MSIYTLNCKDCGGSIAAKVGKAGATCLFCGSDQVSAKALDAQIEQPESFIAFSVNSEEAIQCFKRFASSKFWAPGSIKNAVVELKKLYLPAWIWSGEVESHYTGLKSDVSTLSGKRPFSGRERATIEQALVPASMGVDIVELNAIRPFDTQTLAAWDNHRLDAPYEIGLLTREAAIQEGMSVMKARHTSQISRRESAFNLNNSCIVTSFDGRSALLPVYIGVYRYKETPFRIIVNGVSGATTGSYPLSLLKIAAAIAIAFGLFGIVFALLL